MKKFIFAIFLILNFNLYAATGVLSGEKELRVSKTKWFDLIYPQSCEKSAAILYHNADYIYQEVTEQYGLVPNSRLPVVITPAVESVNAFWSVVPYSHIVLYDTSTDSLNDLSVFSETFLSIFRHELTHAVTFTMKNKFWSTVTDIFGDPVNIGPLMVSTGMSEGATVTSESSSGEGRLNDEYAKHSVVQAKLENKFPSYYGAQGAGDLNPYYFNGAFHEWLQKTYGMAAYTKFWYYTINVQGLTVRKRFKKAFGEKLDKAWNQFIQDYKVPQIEANPIIAKQVKDFFAGKSNNYSRLNNGGAAYESLKKTAESLYWLDTSTKAIFKASLTDVKAKTPNQQKLLTHTGAYSIDVSQDDKLMAISYYNNTSATIKAGIKIYNLETKQLFTIKESGLKDGSVILKDGQYYLVASKFISPLNSIQIYKIVQDSKGKILAVEKTQEILLPLNVFSAEYVQWTNGNIAYIKKDKLKYSICISDLEGNTFAEYIGPIEAMVIHSLSCGEDGQLYFSWAAPGTMPRAGKLELEATNLTTGSFALSAQDISGGVYSPVALTLEAVELVYIGKFLNQNRLLQFTPQFENQIEAFNILQKETDKQEEALPQQFEYELPPSEKFNTLNYFTRGIFMPFSLYTTDFFGVNYNKTPVAEFSVGLSYATGAPWADGTSDLIIATAGWNIFSKSFGMELISNFGTATSLVKTNTDIKTEFDLKGWKFSSAKISEVTAFNFGKTSVLQFTNDFSGKIGRQIEWIENHDHLLGGFYKAEAGNFYYNISENLSMTYSNLYYAGPGNYERAGITTSFGAVYLLDGAFDNSIKTLNGYDFYASLTGFIPRLLPFESAYGFTTNLPTSIGLKVISPEAKKISIYSLSTRTIVFGTLIKQPLPLLNGIYLQDCKITLGYDGSFEPYSRNVYSGSQFLHIGDYTVQIAKGEFEYYHKAYIQGDLKFSPNMGILARNDFQMDLYLKAVYQIRNQNNKAGFTFDLGFDYSF